MLNPQLAYERKRLWLAMIPSVVMVVLLWLFFVIDVSGIFRFPLYRLGILPREVRGLIGVLFSPLLHESFSHLLSNTLPIFMLMWSLFYFYRSIAWKSLLILWILSGFLTWLIGRDSYHIGSSGLIFGLMFFFVFQRYFSQLHSSHRTFAYCGFCIWEFVLEHFPIRSICRCSSFVGRPSGRGRQWNYRCDCLQKSGASKSREDLE
ncbi:rhomboid family intramembrane serine protease [Dysgonamonadaceae bacterium]|nr:rhomboid family intramembrane serine protease [Dysgonamonadaceae bacterium]